MSLSSIFRLMSSPMKLSVGEGFYLASLLAVAWLLMPAQSIAGTCNPVLKTETADFNGACASDILWQNVSNNELSIWFMSGNTNLTGATILSSGVVPASPGAPWVLQGVGDFDGDGNADMLWRNTSTGELDLWLMNGSSILSSNILPYSPSSDWSINGVADFNHDGKVDILWRQATTGSLSIWFMSGATVASTGTIAASPSSDWTIQGIGDFNNDGFADVLWRQTSTGSLALWLMSGATISGGGAINASPNSDWSVQGIGDFNGDGNADILWRQASTGIVAIWLMSSTNIIGSGSPATPPRDASMACCNGVGNGWTIQAVGDYNGDGKSDILWRQTTSGEIAVWLMNGAAVNISVNNIYSPPVAWQVPPLSPYGCVTSVFCNILTATNALRANGPFDPGGHGNPAPSATAGGPLTPMVWSQSAASVAQAYAATCPGLVHNPLAQTSYGFGENIYISEAQSPPASATGTDAVASWASEAANFVYGTNTCTTGECGHYTQLVWRQTNAVGCAVQQCSTNSPDPSFPFTALEVCDYIPEGNFNNLLPY